MSNYDALLLLALPTSSAVLEELENGPRRFADIRTSLGCPPPSTTRGYLRPLTAAGALEVRRHGGFPGSFDYRLTVSGRRLVDVATVAGAWLAHSPVGALALGSEGAKAALRALVESWKTGIAQALVATTPASLTELSKGASALSYPALERRVSALRRLGLVRTSASERGSRTSISPTDWMRRGVGPVTASMSWGQALARVAPADVEAGLLYALGAAGASPAPQGSCRLKVLADEDPNRALVELAVAARGGATVAIDGRLGDWIEALVRGRKDGLGLGGDTAVGDELLTALRRAATGG